ncbi:MAG: PLD nuclease N-terminal domain-containing protein [Vicingaceae bacterium]
METFAGGLGILIALIIAAFFLLLPLLALIDLLRSDFKDSSDKLIWVLIILFLPILGSILYFVMGGNQKLR